MFHCTNISSLIYTVFHRRKTERFGDINRPVLLQYQWKKIFQNPFEEMCSESGVVLFKKDLSWSNSKFLIVNIVNAYKNSTFFNSNALDFDNFKSKLRQFWKCWQCIFLIAKWLFFKKLKKVVKFWYQRHVLKRENKLQTLWQALKWEKVRKTIYTF